MALATQGANGRNRVKNKRGKNKGEKQQEQEQQQPMTIDLNEEGKKGWKKNNKDKVNHNIREAWRWKEWKTAGLKDSKVGKLVGKVPYHPDLYRRAKKWMSDPAKKVILSAGYTSPGELMMCANVPPSWPTTCVWCGKEAGRTEHMLWQCKSRPHGGPKRPECDLQARLGWTAKGTDREADKVMEWITKTVKAVWEKRYCKEMEEEEAKRESIENRYWRAIREVVVRKKQEEEGVEEEEAAAVPEKEENWSEDDDEIEMEEEKKEEKEKEEEPQT